MTNDYTQLTQPVLNGGRGDVQKVASHIVFGERNLEIYRKRTEGGLTLRELSHQYKLSEQRISNIVLRVKHEIEENTKRLGKAGAAA